MSTQKSALHVLMVTPRYYPYMGGIETHVHEVGRRLQRNGLNVTLLTTMPVAMALPREEDVHGMHVIRVPAWPSRLDFYLAPEMYSIITRGNWDIVHCQGCHTFVPLIAMLAAKKAKLPYIVTFHTGGHSSIFRSRIRAIQWQLLRPLLGHATKLIGVSRFEATYFRHCLHLPPDRFLVIPNGITPPQSSETSVTETIPPLIVSTGRLERYKGHQRLITALPDVRKVLPGARLLILGTGSYEATLRQIAQKTGVADHVDIRAIPPGNRQAMEKILSQATLITLLSEYEAHPIAVMEALALQKQVLVANTTGMQELAEQGFVRAISLKSSREEIASAIVQQIQSPLILPEHLTLPTWDDCTQQIQAVYDAVRLK